jgi:hypothetical protein
VLTGEGIEEIDVSYYRYQLHLADGYSFRVVCEDGECETGSVQCWEAHYWEERTTGEKAGVSVPHDVVEEFGASLGSLEAVPGRVRYIGDTDDYPSYRARITTSSGHTVEVLNESNTQRGAGWYLEVNGQWYVVSTDEFEAAYMSLAGVVRPSDCVLRPRQ